MQMFTDEVLERIFAHKELRYVPTGCQAAVVEVVADVLHQMKGEKPNVTVAELLSDYIPGL